MYGDLMQLYRKKHTPQFKDFFSFLFNDSPLFKFLFYSYHAVTNSFNYKEQENKKLTFPLPVEMW